MTARPHRSGASLPRHEVPAGSDAELIARGVAGNISALGVLYDRYHEDVRRFALRRTFCSADADDIVHDVFLDVAKVGATYDGRASALPFLLGIATQVIRSRASKRARISRLLALFAETVSRVVHRTPEDAAGDAREIEHLERIVDRLSEEKRIVLLMIAREGLSGEDVAASLGIPVATVWTRLHYARADVRRALARRRSR